MATNTESCGFQWQGKSYLFLQKMDRSYETYTFEGFNGEIIAEEPVDHPLWKSKSFTDWVLFHIIEIVSST